MRACKLYKLRTLPIVPVQPQTCTVVPFYAKSISHKRNKLTIFTISDHFQYLFNSSLVQSLLISQISWKSTHHFLNYYANKETNRGENITSAKPWRRYIPVHMALMLLWLPRQGSYVFVFVCLSVCLFVSNFAQTLPNGFAWNLREGWQWANEQMFKFWWRSGSVSRRPLAEICTVPVLLVFIGMSNSQFLLLTKIQEKFYVY